MKLVLISIVLLSTVAYGQTVQKYVIDGKTYYGSPPYPTVPMDAEVSTIHLDNVHVNKSDRAAADARLKKDSQAWSREMSQIRAQERASQSSQKSYQGSILRDIEQKEREAEANETTHDWEIREQTRKNNRAK